jgi:hypothetical protein
MVNRLIKTTESLLWLLSKNIQVIGICTYQRCYLVTDVGSKQIPSSLHLWY